MDTPPVSVDANKADGRCPLLRVNSAGGGVGGGNGYESLLEGHESDFSEYSTVAAAHETAGESKRIAGLLEVREPESSKNVLRFLRPMSPGTPLMLQRLRLQRTRLQVKVRESLDCVSLDRLCACPSIHRTHMGVSMRLLVHVILLCPLLLRLGLICFCSCVSCCCCTCWGSGSHGKEEYRMRGFRSGRRFAPCLRG